MLANYLQDLMQEKEQEEEEEEVLPLVYTKS